MRDSVLLSIVLLTAVGACCDAPRATQLGGRFDLLSIDGRPAPTQIRTDTLRMVGYPPGPAPVPDAVCVDSLIDAEYELLPARGGEIEYDLRATNTGWCSRGPGLASGIRQTERAGGVYRLATDTLRDEPNSGNRFPSRAVVHGDTLVVWTRGPTRLRSDTTTHELRMLRSPPRRMPPRSGGAVE